MVVQGQVGAPVTPAAPWIHRFDGNWTENCESGGAPTGVLGSVTVTGSSGPEGRHSGTVPYVLVDAAHAIALESEDEDLRVVERAAVRAGGGHP
jgi:hypothetical protein